MTPARTMTEVLPGITLNLHLGELYTKRYTEPVTHTPNLPSQNGSIIEIARRFPSMLMLKLRPKPLPTLNSCPFPLFSYTLNSGQFGHHHYTRFSNTRYVE